MGPRFIEFLESKDSDAFVQSVREHFALAEGRERSESKVSKTTLDRYSDFIDQIKSPIEIPHLQAHTDQYLTLILSIPALRQDAATGELLFRPADQKKVQDFIAQLIESAYDELLDDQGNLHETIISKFGLTLEQEQKNVSQGQMKYKDALIDGFTHFIVRKFSDTTMTYLLNDVPKNKQEHCMGVKTAIDQHIQTNLKNPKFITEVIQYIENKRKLLSLCPNVFASNSPLVTKALADYKLCQMSLTEYSKDLVKKHLDDILTAVSNLQTTYQTAFEKYYKASDGTNKTFKKDVFELSKDISNLIEAIGTDEHINFSLLNGDNNKSDIHKLTTAIVKAKNAIVEDRVINFFRSMDANITQCEDSLKSLQQAIKLCEHMHRTSPLSIHTSTDDSSKIVHWNDIR